MGQLLALIRNRTTRPKPRHPTNTAAPEANITIHHPGAIVSARQPRRSALTVDAARGQIPWPTRSIDGVVGLAVSHEVSSVVRYREIRRQKATTMAMSDDHKAALVKGRTESRAVKDYLNVLRDRKPGRPVTMASLTDRLAKAAAAVDSEPDPLKRLDLIQTKLDLQDQLASYDQPTDTKAVEDAFIAVAARYSTRKSISYTAWRQVGVPAPVLAKAGIPRTRRN